MRSPLPPSLRALIASPAVGGVLLVAASAIAVLIVNVVPGGAHWYHDLLHAAIGPQLVPGHGPMTVHQWINDGLMAIFFLLVGLEIKREWMKGQLASWHRRTLPFIAATAGMAAPAIIYLWVVSGATVLKAGWAIPAATDIAFAIGALALLGQRVPTSLKLLLTTVAIVDDMGAIAIIAIVYTASLNGIALAAVAILLAVMFAMNHWGVRSSWPYLIGFILLWFAMLVSGVHATLAGVLAAMTIPIDAGRAASGSADSILDRIEHGLHPWSALFVVPIFGFANAGVLLPTNIMGAILSPLPLGIAAGLFIGKQIGIFGAIRVAVMMGIAPRPHGTTWVQLYAMAILCGIGFTMSLFIGGLAFPEHPALIEEAKVGVLTGSLLSALVGLALLRFAPLHPDHNQMIGDTGNAAR